MSWPTTSARSKTWSTEILTASDLQGQLDLLHSYFNDSLNATTGHGHTGGTNDGPKITLTTGVQGTLPIANGGTGVATLAALGSLFYPIGSVYINVTDSTDPATLLGFGTWAALGAGRMIVGFDSGDTNFDTAGETGGANTVTIAQANLPNVNLTMSNATIRSAGGDGPNIGSSANGGSTYTQTVALGGSGTALSVLNKYVTCYTWKRTA